MATLIGLEFLGVTASACYGGSSTTYFVFCGCIFSFLSSKSLVVPFYLTDLAYFLDGTVPS
jgi:hypothetical protein